MASSSRKDLNKIPGVTEFAAILKAEPNWYTLGVFLGLSVGDMTFIQRDNNVHGILQRYIAVYTSLEYQNKLKTWSDIADALRKMDNHALAGNICGGKRLRNNATGATPPPIRKLFSK